MQPLRFVSIFWLIGAMSFSSAPNFAAHAETARIVGLGAATCNRFQEDLEKDPAIIGQYYSWAQGYMSAILLTRPAGVDVNLNLNPKTFGTVQQIEFLSDYCMRNKEQDFPDAVQTLYKVLRAKM